MSDAESGAIVRSMAEQRALQRWAALGAIDPRSAAFAALGPWPTRVAWATFLRRLMLVLGVLLLGAGIVCFVAYNLENLSKFARFYALQALVLVGAGLAAWRGPRSAPGRAALLFASIATGALLALIGQTYQTGADPFELFVAWSLLIIPFALAANWGALWLLFAATLNLGLVLWLGVRDPIWWFFGATPTLVFVLPGLLNAALLAAWEAGDAFVEPIPGRYGPRVLMLASVGFLTVGAWFGVGGIDDVGPFQLIGLWLVAMLAFAAVYRYVRFDLFALSLVAASVISVVAVACGRWLIDAGDFALFGWLILSAVLVGLAVFAAVVLMNLKRSVSHAAG